MDKQRLQELCKINNTNISELEKTLGMSNGSLRKDGEIKSDRLLAIAKKFDVSMEYLMGEGENVVNIEITDLDQGNRERLKAYYLKLLELQKMDEA